MEMKGKGKEKKDPLTSINFLAVSEFPHFFKQKTMISKIHKFPVVSFIFFFSLPIFHYNQTREIDFPFQFFCFLAFHDPNTALRVL